MQSRRAVTSLLVAATLPLSAALYLLLELLLANRLGAEGYAQYSAFSSVAVIITYLASVGIPSASTRFVAEYTTRGNLIDLRSYLTWSIVTGTALALIVGLPISTLYVLLIGELAFPAEVPLVLTASVMGFFLWLWSRQVAIGLGNRWIPTVPKEIVFPVAMAMLVLLWSLDSFLSVAWTYAACLLVIEIPVCLFLLRRYKARLSRSEKWKPLAGQWLAVAVPLGVANLASAGLARWDVVSATSVLPADSAAAYAAAARIALVGSLVYRAFEIFSSRRLVEVAMSGDAVVIRRTLGRAAAGTTLLAVPLLFAVAWFARELLGLFGEFAIQGATVLRCLVLAQVVHCVAVPFDIYMMVAGHHTERAKILVAGSAIVAVSSAVGVHAAGAVGCAIGVLIGVSIYRSCQVEVVRRTLAL